MKIKLNTTYKSLQPFESEELSNFTVIVGKNGSGKSQLLNLIKDKYKEPYQFNPVIDISPNFNNVKYEGIIKDKINNFTNEDWNHNREITIGSYFGYQSDKTRFILIKTIFDNNLERKVSLLIKNPLNVEENEGFLNDSDEYMDLIKKKCTRTAFGEFVEDYTITKEDEIKTLSNLGFNKKHKPLFKFFENLSSSLNKDITELTYTDLIDAPIDEILMDDNDLFNTNIENIFYGYAKRRDVNRKNWFYKNQDGILNNSISETDFINKFTPPWDILNNIFNANNIDFYFKGIKQEEFRDDRIINFNILKKSTDEEIPFTDISSGEKVIIGLILKLFTTEYYKENLEFPDLILLDEPDAHLHPEMSYLLISILKDVFVNKFGINIIITTHSPSTIALVDEDNIFQISNFNNSFLKKISKDEALKMLTSFIPTLSIDYKNHKQVFVESPTDQYYYHSIFDVLSQNKQYAFKLYFVSNDYGKGNSVQVIKTVHEIRSSENNSFYGIIDWDQENNDSDFVKVHGEGNRYSLENYVYDPIYIVILLMTIEAHNIHNELKIANTYNQYNLGFDKELSNIAIKWFFNKFHERFPMSSSEQYNLRKVKYYNDVELELPVWYLEFQGHDLEQRLKLVFTALDKYKKEGALQQELTKIIAKCFPFVHIDTIEVFDKIVSS